MLNFHIAKKKFNKGKSLALSLFGQKIQFYFCAVNFLTVRTTVYRKLEKIIL